MSQLGSHANALQDEDSSRHDEACDIQRRRLLFRSWHRGTHESDAILGSFAGRCVPGFRHAQLARFEALLDCSDPDLFDWILYGHSPPPEHDHDVLRLLRAFCAQRLAGPQPSGPLPIAAIA